MNKKLLKTLAITACSLTFATAVGFGVAETLSNAPANAAEITLETTWLDDRDYGSLFTVPMGEIDGVRADAFAVVSPSGKAYSTQKISLTETGKYTVTWYSVVNGKTVSAKKEFSVTKKAIGLSGDATLKMSDMSQYPMSKASKYIKAADLAGSVHLTLGEGGAFTYNKPVDLTQLGTLESFIDLVPTRGVENIELAYSKNEYTDIEDALVYYIRLTDAYDPTNYVTIEMEWVETSYTWTLRAAAVGQRAHSLKKTSKGAINIGDYNDFYNLIYAPNIGFNRANVSHAGVSLAYDEETNRVYVKASRKIEYATPPTEPNQDRIPAEVEKNKQYLFADLSNEIIYPENAYKGFTTGEVYVSITANGFTQTGEANLHITKFGGEKLSLDMLTEKVNDTTAPIIQSKADFTKFNKIAVGEEISVPELIALDYNLPMGSVATSKVYFEYNYNNGTGTSVGVSDGKFTPNKAGKYTIVYTAKDPSGNTTTKTVDLTCESTYSKAVSLALSSNTFEVDAGLKWTVPNCTVSGFYTDASAVKVYADGKLLEDNVLFLDGIKDYTLTYAYETPFKTYTVECKVQANASEQVVFTDPIFPEYFIANAKYTLDPVFAQEYSVGNPAPYVAEMYMKANNGAYTKVDTKSVHIPDNVTSVQFKYVASNGKSMETEAMKVVNVGFGGELQMKEYFQSNDRAFTKNATKSEVIYTMTSGSTMDYINVVSLMNFSITFTSENLNAIKFTITDYYDRSKVVVLELRALDISGKGYIQAFLNNVAVKLVEDTFGKSVIKYKNGFEVTAGKALIGPFAFEEKFTSDRVLLSISLEGKTVNETVTTPSISISKLYGSNFRNDTKDTTAPFVVLADGYDYQGYQVVGEEITIKPASVTDLFSPYLESGLILEVTTPDGYATIDGITLDGTCPVDREYKLTFTQLGDYDVSFTYVDQNGKSNSYGYTCMVSDSTLPTLVVSGVSYGETVKADYRKKVTVATYTVSDDITDAKDIVSYINVCYPSGLMKEVGNGKTFDTIERGTYYIVYYAYDEFGNLASFYYMVQVD